MWTTATKTSTSSTDEARPARKRRPTAVSQILRRLDRDRRGVPDHWDATTVREEHFRIMVASDRITRERAYRLAFEVYRDADYAPEAEEGLCIHDYDARPDTFTLLVEDESGRDVATVTLVFDLLDDLPCDEIYHDELTALRESGSRLVEVTRLAIAPEYRNSRTLLLTVFNFIYIFARRVRNFTDFVIEVNPRHVRYYQRLLLFEVAGPERPCPRVKGAPAVLLRMQMASIAEKLDDCLSTESKKRTPWQHALVACSTAAQRDEERRIARFLTVRHEPMTSEDQDYFHLNVRACS